MKTENSTREKLNGLAVLDLDSIYVLFQDSKNPQLGYGLTLADNKFDQFHSLSRGLAYNIRGLLSRCDSKGTFNPAELFPLLRENSHPCYPLAQVSEVNYGWREPFYHSLDFDSYNVLERPDKLLRTSEKGIVTISKPYGFFGI